MPSFVSVLRDPALGNSSMGFVQRSERECELEEALSNLRARPSRETEEEPRF